MMWPICLPTMYNKIIKILLELGITFANGILAHNYLHCLPWKLLFVYNYIIVTKIESFLYNKIFFPHVT